MPCPSVLARNSHPNGADNWFTVVAIYVYRPLNFNRNPQLSKVQWAGKVE